MTFFRKRLSRRELARGRSTRHLDTGIPEDPEESLAEAKRRIEDAGWGFYTRRDTYNGRKYSITLRRRIGLSADWESYSIPKKAAILWHELVHIRQRQAMGHSRFVARWLLSPFGRWSLEVPAYRQSIAAYEAMSQGRFNGTAYTKAKASSMRKGYRLGRIDSKQYNQETTKIWHLAREKAAA